MLIQLFALPDTANVNVSPSTPYRDRKSLVPADIETLPTRILFFFRSTLQFPAPDPPVVFTSTFTAVFELLGDGPGVTVGVLVGDVCGVELGVITGLVVGDTDGVCVGETGGVLVGVTGGVGHAPLP